MDPIPASFALGDAAEAVRARLDALARTGFARRLWEHDATLWSDDPVHQSIARGRLGWLDSPAAAAASARELEAFAEGVRRDGFRRAVVLGMGGSSLTAEVLARIFPANRDALELRILDSTSPASVRAVTAACDPADTLFVVSSKSGTTIEVVCFERHFWTWAHAALGAAAGRNFVAITDPGTTLDRLAAERGYRQVFRNAADIGGRFSALSHFGMVPAALLGIDLAALLEHARLEAESSRQESHVGSVPNGFVLGAALGELARRGRDKPTLLLGPDLAPFGDWIEQLVAESTGKNGVGILPVVEEHVAAPETYRNDRVFIAFSAAPLPAPIESAVASLITAGHPVLRWQVPEPAAIGAEFVRWQIATVTAAAILGVDPFDEPNVAESKASTLAILAGLRESPRTPSPSGVEVRFAKSLERLRAAFPGGTPAAHLLALLSLAEPGDYFALLAFLHRTPDLDARLSNLRNRVRTGRGLATTLGYGPRFLHSTGQLHKGGPAHGLFLLLTADEGEDVAIPGEPHGFRMLIRAQASGDFEVLERRARRVLHLHLGADPCAVLDALLEELRFER